MVFGATGGIGKIVAKEFGKAGSHVAVMYRSKEDMSKEVAAEIEASGAKATRHQCDVTDIPALKSAIDDAIKAHGHIHTMVWGAGPLVEQVLIQESTAEQWKTAIDVEVHGFFNAAKHLINHMRENRPKIFYQLRLKPPMKA